MGFHAPGVAPQLFGSSVAVGAWALCADGALGLRGLVGLGVHRRGMLLLAAGLIALPVASGQVTRVELWLPCLLTAAVLGRIGLIRWPELEAPATLAIPPETRTRPVVASRPETTPVVASRPETTPMVASPPETETEAASVLQAGPPETETETETAGVREAGPGADSDTAPSPDAVPAASGATNPASDKRGPAPTMPRAAARARVFGRVAARAGTIISRDVNVAIPRAARAAGRAAGRVRRPPEQP
jgi:hypothetical protein